jgi:PRTRC genetic system ThiF family protein
MIYTVQSQTRNNYSQDLRVCLVGCGGTGGFVAEGLARLLAKNMQIVLVDFDKVEEHNLQRQAFYRDDLGKFKSEVLARRLATQFHRRIGFTTIPVNTDYLERFDIVIACVDNAQARQVIHDMYQFDGVSGYMKRPWWIDAGNGENSGQVLIGNTKSSFEGSFQVRQGVAHRLPLPSVQQPGLLIPPTVPAKQEDCAEAVENNVQSPVINQAMAAMTLEITRRFIKGELTWMGVYVDLDAGAMRPVLVEAETVARMTGLKTGQILDRKGIDKDK